MVYALNRSPRRFGSALALMLACLIVGLVAMGGTARADSSDWFCPWNNGAGGTITLGANTGCTVSFFNSLTQVAYYHQAGANVNHCAVSKFTSDPGGSGANVIPAVCGFGSGAHGLVLTSYFPNGLGSYARGKNNEGATHFGFYGIRWWK